MQLLNQAAGGKFWPVWSRGGLKLGHVQDGIFPGKDYHLLSASLQELVRQSVPMLEAPYALKKSLNKAGHKNLKEFEPGTLR